MRPLSRIGITLLLVLLVAAACVSPFTQTGSVQTVNESVALEGAERVDVDIRPGVQDLTLRGGADGLFSGQFRYNHEQLEPQVDYRVNNGVGKLDVTMARTQSLRWPTGNVISEWDLQLSNEVPLALNMSLGLGDSQIDLSDLTLTELDIESGAGRVNVNVGEQQMDRVRVRAGLGDTALKFAGGSIDRFDFEGGAGSVSVDLTGDWTSDLNAQIRGGLGSIDLMIPSDVGVRIEVNKGLGDVDANGLRVDDNVYTNDLYGSSDVTLEIELNQGAGDINIQIAN